MGAHPTNLSNYLNANGFFRTKPQWSWELKMTARFAYVTTICRGVEMVYFMHVLKGFLSWRQVDAVAAITHPADWCFLCIVAAIRWPRVVCHALTLLEGAEPRDMTVEGWHAYIVRLLMVADRHKWDDMWVKISPGRASVRSGLCCLAKRLGVIAKVGKEDGSRRRAKGCQGQVLTLGSNANIYRVQDVSASRARVMEIMNVSAPPWPTQHQGEAYEMYGRAVSGMAALFMGPASDLGGGYLARRLLSLVELEQGAEVWDPLPMGTVQSWLPDMNKHTEPLHTWTCARVRKEFCMSPLQVSSVACFWGQTNKEAETCLVEAKPSAILNAVRDLMRYEEAPSQDGMTVQLPWWPATSELANKMLGGTRTP